MRRLGFAVAATSAACGLAACGGSTHGGADGDAGAGGGTGNGGGAPSCPSPVKGIAHVVVIVQENHTFDTYFGSWCTAPTGSSPTCTGGPSCCEAGPAKDPTGASPVTLDDAANAAYDPNHSQACELAEIDNGKMDGFVKGPPCANAGNFAYAPAAVAGPYQKLAAEYAIADRYFQPIAGESSSNNMYLAVAREVFLDNAYEPSFTGDQCSPISATMSFTAPTILDLLTKAGKTVGWYGEGFAAMQAAGTGCPMPPSACAFALPTYPCVFDPGDVPFVYYPAWASTSTFVRDYAELAKDLAAGKLPDVSYVKGLGYHTEHPGTGVTISAGTAFVEGVLTAIQGSCYANDTLILLTWDEGGGFFDHVTPPPTSTVDMQPYGTRVPLLAIGPFAKKGTVSHVVMEHSSIVKFLEWNFLGGATGQLGARDAVVHNIGSLLDPAATGVTVPAD